MVLLIDFKRFISVFVKKARELLCVPLRELLCVDNS